MSSVTQIALPPDLPSLDEPGVSERRLGLPPEAILPRNDLAVCLPVLLRALGWRGDTRHLAEALPHFGGPLDVTGFRRVMADLGYRSVVRRGVSARRLRAHEMPCLFLPHNRDAMVVVEHDGGEALLFDSTGLRTEATPRRKGDAVVFAPVVDAELATVATGQTSWLFGVLKRFYGHLWLAMYLSAMIAVIAIASPLYVMAVYDRVLGTGSVSTLTSLLTGMGVAMLAEMVMRDHRARVLARAGARIDILVGRAVFERLLRLTPAMTEGSTVGAQIARVKDFETVREFLTGPAAASVLDLPFSIFIIGLVYALAGPLGLVPTVAATALMLLGLWARDGLRQRVGAGARASALRQELALETLTRHRLLRTTGAVDTWLHRYRMRSANAAQAAFHTTRYVGLLGSLAHGIVVTSGIATVWFGANMVIAGTMSVGGLIAAMMLLWRALTPFQASFMVLARSEQVRSSMRQIDRLMEMQPEQPDRATVRPVNAMRGDIAVARFSVRYSADSEPALLGVNFEVTAGEVVAVVGRNGAGKSTLVKALAGMVRGQTGIIKVDGMDIRRFDPVEYRRTIAYAPDEATVFRGTVAQNILLADASATPEQVREAAQAAGLLDDHEELRDGLETRLGDQQVSSPSVRTRIALARVVLRNAPIVLLDEPVGGLDADGDEVLMNVIRRLKGRSTVFVVTHRPSHVRLADKILELRDGQVLRFGPVPDMKQPQKVAAPPPTAAKAITLKPAVPVGEETSHVQR